MPGTKDADTATDRTASVATSGVRCGLGSDQRDLWEPFVQAVRWEGGRANHVPTGDRR